MTQRLNAVEMGFWQRCHKTTSMDEETMNDFIDTKKLQSYGHKRGMKTKKLQ